MLTNMSLALLAGLLLSLQAALAPGARRSQRSGIPGAQAWRA